MNDEVLTTDGKMVTIDMRDTALRPLMRRLLIPILHECGVRPDMISAVMDDPAGQGVGTIIAHIRDMRSRLDLARKKFKQMHDKQKQDYETMITFMKHHLPN